MLYRNKAVDIVNRKNHYCVEQPTNDEVTIEPADFKKRCLAKGPRGEFLSLLTGNETEKERRDLIIQIVQAFQNHQQCPAEKTHLECPFRIMSGLSHASLKNLVKSMPLADCLHLFELERQCRTNPTPT